MLLFWVVFHVFLLAGFKWPWSQISSEYPISTTFGSTKHKPNLKHGSTSFNSRQPELYSCGSRFLKEGTNIDIRTSSALGSWREFGCCDDANAWRKFTKEADKHKNCNLESKNLSMHWHHHCTNSHQSSSEWGFIYFHMQTKNYN